MTSSLSVNVHVASVSTYILPVEATDGTSSFASHTPIHHAPRHSSLYRSRCRNRTPNSVPLFGLPKISTQCQCPLQPQCSSHTNAHLDRSLCIFVNHHFATNDRDVDASLQHANVRRPTNPFEIVNGGRRVFLDCRWLPPRRWWKMAEAQAAAQVVAPVWNRTADWSRRAGTGMCCQRTDCRFRSCPRRRPDNCPLFASQLLRRGPTWRASSLLR
jgi:hypothetical protein